MTTVAETHARSFADRGPIARAYRRYLGRASLFMFAMHPHQRPPAADVVHGDDGVPAARGSSTTPGAPVWPASPQTAQYQGQDYPVYTVPFPDGGSTRQRILYRSRARVEHVHRPDRRDPDADRVGGSLADPRAGVDVRAAHRQLHHGLGPTELPAAPAQHLRDRAPEHDRRGDRSSILVAYGFARFRFPGKNALFVVLIATTIILPFQVTLLPQYVLFTSLGWNGTWLPLIIPHCFANAYNVFLLRQYFMSIPRELDEAAMIDGAGPFRILRFDHRPAVGRCHHRGQACSTSSSPGTTSSCRCSISGASPSRGRSRSQYQQYNALYASQPTLTQASARVHHDRPDRRLLARTATLHARRRGHRRGQVGLVPAAARNRVPRPGRRRLGCATAGSTTISGNTSSPARIRRCRGSTTSAARSTSRSSPTPRAATRSTATPGCGG